jgi:hypothetical protein
MAQTPLFRYEDFNALFGGGWPSARPPLALGGPGSRRACRPVGTPPFSGRHFVEKQSSKKSILSLANSVFTPQKIRNEFLGFVTEFAIGRFWRSFFCRDPRPWSAELLLFVGEETTLFSPALPPPAWFYSFFCAYPPLVCQLVGYVPLGRSGFVGLVGGPFQRRRRFLIGLPRQSLLLRSCPHLSLSFFSPLCFFLLLIPP